MFEQLEKYIPFLTQQNTRIVQVFIIVFVALLLDFFQKKILRRIQRQLDKTSNLWDDALVYAIIKPLSVLIWLASSALTRSSTSGTIPPSFCLSDSYMVSTVASMELTYYNAT